MKKYFIIVFWKALEVSYKSFSWGRDCPVYEVYVWMNSKRIEIDQFIDNYY